MYFVAKMISYFLGKLLKQAVNLRVIIPFAKNLDFYIH